MMTERSISFQYDGERDPRTLGTEFTAMDQIFCFDTWTKLDVYSVFERFPVNLSN